MSEETETRPDTQAAEIIAEITRRQNAEGENINIEDVVDLVRDYYQDACEEDEDWEENFDENPYEKVDAGSENEAFHFTLPDESVAAFRLQGVKWDGWEPKKTPASAD